jgi:nitroreductase
MDAHKHATTDYAIHAHLAQRWSPRAFADRAVSEELLGSLFEAARWAASCYNEQPWRFIVARREQPDEYQRLLSCLVEGNQAWATSAPLLGLGVLKKTFTLNGKPNKYAQHDLGLATAGLMTQATAHGLYYHAMGGILPERAVELYRVPEDFQVLTGFAIGYLGDPDTLADDLRESELEVRTRRPLEAMVFASGWEQPAGFLGR